jgi:hypothetical protein
MAYRKSNRVQVGSWVYTIKIYTMFDGRNSRFYCRNENMRMSVRTEAAYTMVTCLSYWMYVGLMIFG